MIPSSGVYRIPRADAASRNADAVRFARTEYGSSSLSWMLRSRPASPGLWTRVAAGLTAALRGLGAPSARASADPAPLRTGVAAVHFAGEPVHVHAELTRPHAHPHWGVTPAGTLLLPVMEADEKPEACECQP